MFLNSDDEIDTVLFTHSGAIQSQESTLYGLWNDNIEKYKTNLTAANYQSYFDKTIEGQLAKAKKQINMLKTTLHDKNSQISQLLDINEQMFDFIKKKIGRDEWIKWQESQK